MSKTFTDGKALTPFGMKIFGFSTFRSNVNKIQQIQSVIAARILQQVVSACLASEWLNDPLWGQVSEEFQAVYSLAQFFFMCRWTANK